MSLKLGGSKEKSSSTSTSNFSNTTTPLVPEWASRLTQDIAGRVGGVGRIDPQSLVAPAQPLHASAAAVAGDLNGIRWNFDAAADLLRGTAGGVANGYQANTWGGADPGAATSAASHSVLENLDSYMSPYRRQVVDAALADFDYGAGQTRAQQDLDLAGSGAFGGSGAALTRSMTEDALTRGRAATSANLLDQMFQRGAALSSEDANRRQQAALANAGAANQFALSRADLSQQAGLANMAALNEAARYNAGAEELALQRRADAARSLADISSAYEANQRANVATQSQMADTLRGIDQEQRQAPVTSAQQLVAMLSGLPIGLFTGEQKTGTETTTGSSTKKGMNWSAGVSAADAVMGMTGIPL